MERLEQRSTLVRAVRAALAVETPAWLALVEEALAAQARGEGTDPRLTEWLQAALARAQTPEVMLEVARVAFAAEHPGLGRVALDRAYDEAAALGPDAEFEGALGALRMRFDDPLIGQTHLRRAIAVATDARELVALIDAHHPLLDAATLTEALRRHTEQVAAEGPSTVGCLALCDLYRKLGWSDSAAAHRVAWDAVAGPDDLFALFAHACALGHRPGMEAAARALEAARAAEGNADWRVWDALAACWHRAGDAEGAARCGRRALAAGRARSPEDGLDALAAWARRTGEHLPYVAAVRGWWATATEATALVERAAELVSLDASQAELAFRMRQRAFRLPGGRRLGPVILAALIAEGHPRAEGLLGALWTRAKSFTARLDLIALGRQLRPDWAQEAARRLLEPPQPWERLVEAIPRLPEPEATRQWEALLPRATTARTLRAALELALQTDRPELGLLFDRWQRLQRRRSQATEAAAHRGPAGPG